MHIWVIVAFCCILLYFVAFCCILLYFVAFCCTLVEREVSEWGRPQLPSAPPWPHHSSTSVVVVIVIVVVVVVLLISLKHQLCSVEARIPISRMRNPEIISVSCQITNCWNILKLSTLPTFSCLCKLVFSSTKHSLALFLSLLIIVVHAKQFLGLSREQSSLLL